MKPQTEDVSYVLFLPWRSPIPARPVEGRTGSCRAPSSPSRGRHRGCCSLSPEADAAAQVGPAAPSPITPRTSPSRLPPRLARCCLSLLCDNRLYGGQAFPGPFRGADPVSVWVQGSARVVRSAAGQPLCCEPLCGAILGGGVISRGGGSQGQTGVCSSSATSQLSSVGPGEPWRSVAAAGGRPCRPRSSAASPPRQPSPPRPGRELHLPRRQCVPTPSHRANLIKLPPNLCAKVVRNARAVFHEKYESEQPQAR